jgi:hypothetical protein
MKGTRSVPRDQADDSSISTKQPAKAAETRQLQDRAACGSYRQAATVSMTHLAA